MDEVVKERAKTLTRLSGLIVTAREKNNVSEYTFSRGKQNLKTVFTYRKARMFAEGVSIGRAL